MQTETMVSARPSAHPGHSAADQFSREFDLADLLALVPAATPKAAVPLAVPVTQPVAEPEPEPESSKSLNDIFANYLKYEKDIRALTIAQGVSQKLLFGSDWTTIVDSLSTQGIYRVANQAVSNLIRLAQSRFAPTGGRLDICEFEVLEAVGMKNWRDEYDRQNRRSETEVMPPVDLDKIWAYLEATYAGDAGIETAHTQNAQFIIKEFRLDGDAEMKRTSSSVSCFLRLWAKKLDYGSNKGMYEIGSYNTRDELIKLFKGLAIVFEWAEMDQLSIELAPARHRIGDYNFVFKPRDRASFTGLDIVYFKEQWEWKWSHAAADKLMLYLGTYGQP